MNEKNYFIPPTDRLIYNEISRPQPDQPGKDTMRFERAESQPKLRELFSNLEHQDKELDELMTEMTILVERVDRIANNMDAANYSKNQPSPESPDKLPAPSVHETKSTGIVLEFELAIERRRRMLKAIQGRIIPLMSEGISYLERHI